RGRGGRGVVGGGGGTSLFGGKSSVGYGQEQGPLPLRANADHLSLGVAGHAGDRKTAHPAGGGIIGMVLAARGLADDLRIAPPQTAKVIGQGDTREPCCRRRAAALADRDVIPNAKSERMHLRALGFENLAVSGEDEVILHGLADSFIASGRVNRETSGGTGIDRNVEIHRQS